MKKSFALLIAISSAYASFNMQSFTPSHGHSFTYSEETLRNAYNLFTRSNFYFSTNYSYHESPLLVRNNQGLETERLDSLELRAGYLFDRDNYFGISSSANQISFNTQNSDWAMGDTTLLYKYQLPFTFNKVNFAFSPSVVLPTGESDLLLSDNSVALQTSFIASRSWGKIDSVANVGFRYAGNSEFNNVETKERVITALGANYHFNDKFAMGPEFYQEYTIDTNSDNYFKHLSVNSHYRLNRSSKLFASVGTGDISNYRGDHFRVIFGIKMTPTLIHNRTINLVKEIPRGTETETVFFASNSTQLTDSGKKRLRELVKELGTDQKVHIIGSADKSGNEDYNTILSIKRALAVKNYLNQLGMKIKAVDTTARGELSATQERVIDEDRRVDIVIE